MSTKLTRREMLKKTGMGVAGAAVLTSVPAVLVGCGDAAVQETSVVNAEHPWKYEKLDPDATADRAYNAFMDGGNCCTGVADALYGGQADLQGAPFDLIDPEAFRNGGAGYGAGTLCGSLGAAVSFIGDVTEGEDQAKITQEIFNWYRNSEIPQYYAEGEEPTETVVPDSVNCEVSVDKYMDKTGYGFSDPERKRRCANITADVARQTAILLNDHYGLA